ncbi:MAG: single-stranded DNA-binding protein [Anaerolineae bacterium]|nr:single-stranded DNA-binding protein [Anaerolineales bacterium]MCQ3978899.1 single-stranded DNA-binding protein [Anaerolineae bacterium]
MASGYSKLLLLGNLGSDPEMRYIGNGQPVTNFSLAVNNTWTDKQTGEVVENTAWYRISVWGAQAETCNRYLSKGRQILVEGQLTFDKETGGPRIWQDQNGKARASFEVKAFDVRFLGSANGNGNGSTTSSNQMAGVEELTEDEIPF